MANRVGDLVMLRHSDPFRPPGMTLKIPVWTYDSANHPCYDYASEDVVGVLLSVTEHLGAAEVMLLSGERWWVRLGVVNTVQRAEEVRDGDE
jgi:hypothetical protein